MTPNGVRDKESQYYRMIRVRRGIQLVYSRVMAAHLPEQGHVCLRIQHKKTAEERAGGAKVFAPSCKYWRGVDPLLWMRPAMHPPARPPKMRDASHRPHHEGDEFANYLAEGREPSRHFKAGRTRRRRLRNVEAKNEKWLRRAVQRRRDCHSPVELCDSSVTPAVVIVACEWPR